MTERCELLSDSAGGGGGGLGGCRSPVVRRGGARGLTGRVVNPLRVVASRRAGRGVTAAAGPIISNGLLKFIMFELVFSPWFRVI